MSEKADIKELAVAAWRLEKWLNNLNADRKMAAKSALRSIKKYISASGVEVKDPLGSKFDPGLAVEVVNSEAEEAPEEELIIVETLAPYVYQDGELIQYARVIIGTAVKEAKANNATVDDPTVADASETTVVPENENGTIDLPAEPVPAETDKISMETSAAKAEDEVKIDESDIERMMAYAKIL